MLAFVLQNYLDYYESKNEENKKIILKKYQDIIYNSIPILLFIGAFMYTNEKYLEYGNKFKFETFILGNTNCRNN